VLKYPLISSGVIMNNDLFNKAALQIIAGSMPPHLSPTSTLAGLVSSTMDFIGAEPSTSTVDHPTHYRAESGIEAIEAIEAWDLNFNLGNVVKYVCRAGLKSGNTKEDLEKALWYLQRELSNIDDTK